MTYNLNHKAITVEKAKELDIEDEVIDLWMSSTKASPHICPDIILDWYSGKLNLIVNVE